MNLISAASRAPLAFLVSGVLIAALASPVAAEELSEPPGAAEFPASTGAAVAEPTPVSGDYSDHSDDVVVDAGSSVHPQVSLADDRGAVSEVVEHGRVVSRSEFGTTYELDGRYASVTADVPVHTRADGGGWAEVSTELSRGAEGVWGVTEHPLSPEFGTAEG